MSRIHLAKSETDKTPSCGRETASPSISFVEFCGPETLSTDKRITNAFQHCTMCARRAKKILQQPATKSAPADEFTNLEAKRTAMRTGITKLLASLSLTRRDMCGMGDAEILDALATTYTGLGVLEAGALLAGIATTARELEQVTPESLGSFFAVHNARIEAERAVSPAAQELAASWAQDTRTPEQRLADYNERHAAFGLSIAADIRATGLRMTNPSDRLERFDTAARIVDEVRA